MRKVLLIPVLLVMILSSCGRGSPPKRISIEAANFVPEVTTTSSTTSTSTSTSTTQPTPPSTTRTTSRANGSHYVAVPDGAFWARLRACESPTNGGTRYRGYYQFAQSTWQAAGGSGDPAAASLEEQTARADWLLHHANPYKQWPVCYPRAIKG